MYISSYSISWGKDWLNLVSWYMFNNHLFVTEALICSVLPFTSIPIVGPGCQQDVTELGVGKRHCTWLPSPVGVSSNPLLILSHWNQILNHWVMSVKLIVRYRSLLILQYLGISGAKMMYFLDKSRQEKAIAIATRLDETVKDKNVKVRFFRISSTNLWMLSNLAKCVSL